MERALHKPSVHLQSVMDLGVGLGAGEEMGCLAPAQGQPQVQVEPRL